MLPVRGSQRLERSLLAREELQDGARGPMVVKDGSPPPPLCGQPQNTSCGPDSVNSRGLTRQRDNLLAEVDHTECNLARDIALSGHIARRTEESSRRGSPIGALEPPAGRGEGKRRCTLAASAGISPRDDDPGGVRIWMRIHNRSVRPRRSLTPVMVLLRSIARTSRGEPRHRARPTRR
jgi:hypothetical protein